MHRWGSQSNGLENLAYHTFNIDSDSIYWEQESNFTKLIKDNFNHNDCHVIPAIINKMFDAKIKNKKKINLFGSGNQKREFLYIEDAATALLKAINLPIKTDIINVGTGKVITIKKLADKIKKIMNFNGSICWNSEVNSGIFKKNFSTTISKKYLKFYPKFTLETGLKKTISWYSRELKSKIY